MTVIYTSTTNNPVVSGLNETQIVAPDVSVDRLYSDWSGVRFLNYGTVLSPGIFAAVSIMNGTVGGTFTNQVGGTVIQTSGGGTIPAVLINAQASVTNLGTILSNSHGISLAGSFANDDVISNSGDIEAGQNGIWISGANAQAVTVINSGAIWGDANGIHMQNAAGAAPVIFNTGVISGRTNSIVATDGDRLNVTNNGTLQGHVVATTVNGVDSVTNNGRIVGDVKLGSGADVYKGVGTVSGTIYGEAGADTLTGGSSTDRLNGGADGDKLNGGIGIDYETGGLGNDIFIFNTPLNSANRDVILDFHNASGDNDTFWLDNAYMTKLGAANHVLNPAFFYAGAAAHDANDYIVYNKANGYLYYDSNGNAAGGATLLAVITNKPALAYTDFVVI